MLDNIYLPAKNAHMGLLSIKFHTYYWENCFKEEKTLQRSLLHKMVH